MEGTTRIKRDYYNQPFPWKRIKTTATIEDIITRTYISVLSSIIGSDAVPLIPEVSEAVPTFCAKLGKSAVPSITKTKPITSSET